MFENVGKTLSKRFTIPLPFVFLDANELVIVAVLFGSVQFGSVSVLFLLSNHYHQQPVKISPWQLLCRNFIIVFLSLGFPSFPSYSACRMAAPKQRAPGSVKCKCLFASEVGVH